MEIGSSAQDAAKAVNYPAQTQLKSDAMTSELARQAAKQIAALLVDTRIAYPYEAPDGVPINLTDVLGIGAVVTAALIAYSQKAPSDSVKSQLEVAMKLIGLGTAAQPQLEEMFSQVFVEGSATPEQMRDVVMFAKGLLSNPGRLRTLLTEVTDEIAPASRPGAAPKLPVGSEDAIVALSREVLPAASLLRALHAMLPSKPVAELIETLATDHLSEAVLLVQHTSIIEAALAKKEFQDLKSDSAKAQFLADAIAGHAIAGLRPTYAHQRADSARRLQKRHE